MERDSTLKVAAFFEEFPFLSKFITQRKVYEVKVQRVDVELFNKDQGKIYFLDKDGNKIGRVRNNIWWTILGKKETNAQTLFRLGDKAREVFFVLHINYLDLYVHGLSKSLVLYKRPLSGDLLSWSREVLTQHRQKAEEI